MTKPTPADDARVVELQSRIAEYDMLVATALERNQVGSAVGALHGKTATAKELRSLLIAREISAITDPVKRLERIRQEAVANESHVAAAQLGRQIEEARAKQDAERAEAAERKKKKPTEALDRLAQSIALMPDKMREDLFRRVEERRQPRPVPN